MKKNLVITITIFLFLSSLFSQTGRKELGFFSPLYNTKDEVTAKLIVDLYYNHLLTNNTISLKNLRTHSFPKTLSLENYDIDIALSIDISDLQKNWTIGFHAISKGKKYTQERSYDSYFQILLEAKNEIFSFIETILDSKTIEESKTEEKSLDSITMTLDSIAGTWFTDTNIDKIIILRGGRGFVIFKNGATMNIAVQIKGSQIIAMQTSQTNASFLPELPRDLALKAAADGLEPIAWEMTAKNQNEMVGEKKHYEAVYEGDNAVSVQNISSPSRWTR